MRPVIVPPEIGAALDGGAMLVVSMSGGKDSHALLAALAPLARDRAWNICAVHADLGRAEWPETEAFVPELARRYGVQLHVVRRDRGDLFARFEEREAALAGTGKPFWPSSQARYCTSDLKRDPINKLLRTWSGVVVSAEGVRWQESDTRAKKPCWDSRDAITTQTRSGVTWNAIVDWSLDDVWEAIGTSAAELDRRRELYAAGDTVAALDGWPAHPAYVYGNERLSCAFCILGSKNDLTVAARHLPDKLEYLVSLERRSGFTFKGKQSLADIVGLDSTSQDK